MSDSAHPSKGYLLSDFKIGFMLMECYKIVDLFAKLLLPVKRPPLIAISIAAIGVLVATT